MFQELLMYLSAAHAEGGGEVPPPKLRGARPPRNRLRAKPSSHFESTCPTVELEKGPVGGDEAEKQETGGRLVTMKMAGVSLL